MGVLGVRALPTPPPQLKFASIENSITARTMALHCIAKFSSVVTQGQIIYSLIITSYVRVCLTLFVGVVIKDYTKSPEFLPLLVLFACVCVWGGGGAAGMCQVV